MTVDPIRDHQSGIAAAPVEQENERGSEAEPVGKSTGERSAMGPLLRRKSRRRTVMQVTWSLVAGGSEMYALTVASGLDSQRYDSVLCALDQGGALENEITGLGIPYFVMNRRPGIELGLMWRLYRLFRKAGVDVVHTHHFTQLFYSGLAAKLAGARLIHTEHCVQHLDRRRLRVALRVLSLLCDRVIGIGGEVVRTLGGEIGIPAPKLELVRAGVNVAAFGGLKSEARQALRLDEADRVAVIVARLSPEKNHRMLLAAFAAVVRRLPRARLLIVGGGAEQADIQEEILRLGLADHVRLLGVRRDVPRILAAADVFVLSSNEEGLPIAVLEAMAAAKPVVVTAVGELPLLVKEGETGRLSPPQDPPAFAAALLELLSDEALAIRMGASGRQLVEQQYSLASMIETHERLYD
jgi:L-malate glycosyltransferase